MTPLHEAEHPQADPLAEDAADRRFRRNVWTVAACGLAAFWIGIAGLIAMIGAE